MDAFTIERRDQTVHLGGELRLENAERIWRELTRVLSASERAVTVDLGSATKIDATVVALLIDLRAELAMRGVHIELTGAKDALAELVVLYGGSTTPQSRTPTKRSGLVEELGDHVRRTAIGARNATVVLGETVRGALGAIRRPITADWRSTFPLVARAGTDAIPLVLLLNYLLGFVMGYESSRQLERYGASHFVADVVGVAVTRELAPVMTCIIVVGRSVAAYAAELGTMKVSDELDALRTMGFVPARQLVVPRLLALAIVTPLLTLLADVAGIAGGVTVGVVRLDVSPSAFLTELRLAIGLRDVIGGLIKASVAGVTAAMIGVQQGMATEGGPAGVGARTTSTVVKSLVAIILIDAFFAVFLKAIGN